MNVPECPFGVRIQRARVTVIVREIRLDGMKEARLPELAEDHGAELWDFQWRRAQSNQRFAPRSLIPVPVRPGDPLRQHRKGAASLLVLRQSLPLALEHGEGRRMERIAGFKSGPQKVP